ncbi:hypothetical protein [Streptomyces alboflavus]|uniref:hypothetical protein n=1 Tax=Streptomyces alboflavus TaxID=67267 RepID=UPI00369EDD15
MLLAEQGLVGLRLRGQHVRAAVTVFADEARRRSDAGLGAVDSRALLTVLYDLPAGVSVPLATLDPYALRALHTAPAGVVEIDVRHGTAVRRLVPAVRVELVLVHGPDGVPARAWDSAVRDASQFAPFCARGVVVADAEGHENAPDVERLLLKARYYGVGVATQGPHRLHWLLEPAPYRPRRHSPAQWLFHEHAWRQLVPEWSWPLGSAGTGNGSGLGRRQA